MTTLSWNDRTGAFSAALLDPQLDVPSGIVKGENAAPRRFGVYRNNVVVSLIEALGAAYPSTKAVLGDENFTTIARAFIFRHPPRSAMMQRYGEAFPTWMADLPALSEIPFLHDLASLERAVLDAFHAVDAEPLAPDDLATVAPDDVPHLTFERHPAAFVVASDYAIHDLYLTREGHDYGDPDTAQAVLVTRPEFEVQTQQIDAAAAAAFDALFDGHSLGEALARAEQLDDSFEPARFIALAISSGALRAPRKDTTAQS